MIFFRPIALSWALLAVPIVLLYLRRISPRRRRVATGFLWEQVLSERPFELAWFRWRRPASLCAQLSIVALMVLAMAEPLVRPPRRVVMIVDNSASTDGADVEQTSLDRIRQSARQRVRKLGRHDRMAIISAGGNPHVCCPFSSKRAVLEEAIENLPLADEPADLEAAIGLGRQILTDSPNDEIIVLGDAGTLGQPGSEAAAAAVSFTGPPLWTFLAAVALLALVIEWSLFWRRWTC